jgi:hypothetical protein
MISLLLIAGFFLPASVFLIDLGGSYNTLPVSLYWLELSWTTADAFALSCKVDHGVNRRRSAQETYLVLSAPPEFHNALLNYQFI